MRKCIFALAALGLAACQQDGATENQDQYVLSQEIFTSQVGANKVYGVQFKATASEQTMKGFAIQLAQNDAVWADTLLLDLAPGDTLENEIIFSDAVARESDNTQLRIESFDLGK